MKSTKSKDLTSDMLARIKNVVMRGVSRVDVPFTKLNSNIVSALHTARYVESYSIKDIENVKFLSINLRCHAGRPVITNLRRISKSSRRVYAKSNSIPYILNGVGTSIISTSHGVMTDKEARSKNIGGEIVAVVW